MSDGSLVITDETMSEIGDGFYKFNFGGYHRDRDYSIRADGGATLDDVDRYMYASNEFDVSIGGGLGITGDMIFDMKRIADNIISKKDLDEFLKKLAKKLGIMKDKLDEDELKSQELSKMSARINDNINFLMKNNVKNDKLKTEVEKTVNSLKRDFNQISDALQVNKEELANMIKLNESVVNNIIKIDQKTNLEEFRKQLEESHNEMVKLDNDRVKMLSDINNSLNLLSNNFNEVSKHTEDNIKQNLGEDLVGCELGVFHGFNAMTMLNCLSLKERIYEGSIACQIYARLLISVSSKSQTQSFI